MKKFFFKYLQDETNFAEYDCALVVFSLTDFETFEEAKRILNNVLQHDTRHLPLILVANKSDLVRTRQVTEEGLIYYFLPKQVSKTRGLRH